MRCFAPGWLNYVISRWCFGLPAVITSQEVRLTKLEFTIPLTEAAVFNYLADRIKTQIETIQKVQGLVLEAVHVAAPELCETCDRCQETVLPTIAFYDGKQFLCPDRSDAGPAGLAP